MDIQDVDEGGLELRKRSVKRMLQRLPVHAAKVRLDDLGTFVRPPASRVLGGNHHLVAIASFFHPLSYPRFRLPMLVNARCVHEIATAA